MISKPSKDVAAALKGLPPSVRTTLRRQCDGDWDRVTLEIDGSFKVHNRPDQAMDDYARRLASIALPSPSVYAEPSPSTSVRPSTPRSPAAPAMPPPPKPKLRTVVDLTELRTLAGTTAPTPTAGGVRIVTLPNSDRPAPPQPIYSDFDLEQSRTYPVDELLSKSANDLRDRFQGGLPMAIRYSHLPDVLALYGVDEDIMDAALRHPERVEIRPESFDKDKRYPVLSFRRGDMLVILGLRTPAAPKVIAAYVSSLLMHDTHRVDHQGGGGAKRGEKGLPTNPRAAVKSLRMLGAHIAPEEVEAGKPASITYLGQSLGHIRTAERTPKADVQSDYQRCVRRIHAIDRRQGATA